MHKFEIEVSSESRATEEQTVRILRDFLSKEFIYQNNGRWTADFKIFLDGKEL